MSEVEAVPRRLGRYELIAELASGGMGIVCLARSGGAGGFQRLFAIKVMHPHLVENAQFVAMLLDEARLAARIHHPNVVATVDICTLDNCYFLVMDYIDGFQLLEFIDHPGVTREQRIRVVCRILIDAMKGLDAAHSLASDDGSPLGLVHRDVSPQNIMIGLDGIGRLTDFGIALAASRITSSRPGMIKGKPSYMAPEQARATVVDQRADVWALGVILWEGLTGQRLFIGQSEAATMLKVIEQPIRPPSSVDAALPTGFDTVCLRALERDPERRYASARQMAGELERAASAAGLLADSHEVADSMKQLFANEIRRRRMAIRGHAAAIGPSSGPLGPRDIYSLPKLSEDLPSGVILQASPLPSMPIPTPTPSVSSVPSVGPGVVRGTVPATVIGTSTEISPRRAGRSRGVAIGIGVFLIAALGFALKSPIGSLFAPSSDVAQGEADERAAGTKPAPVSDVRPPEVAPSSQPSTSDSGAGAPFTVAPLQPAPGPIRAARRPHAPAWRAPAAAVEPRPSAAAAAGQAPAPERRGPAVEENPYGLR